MSLIIPILFITIIIIALIKKVNVFSSFTQGAKEGLSFTISIAPILGTIFIMCALFEASGLSSAITKLMAPALKIFGIPETLAKFILIKPFSGSGSLSLLTEIIADNGADSYIARCACVMYGSSETVFYISAIYFAKRKKNKIILPILIVLTTNILTAILSCFICQFL